jgi:hypothetical protein
MQWLPLFFALTAGVENSVEGWDGEWEPYEAIIDPVVQARVLSASSQKEARRLGGVYGLCGDGVTIPENAGLVCDPPNTLPQICTLVCKKGYYSTGDRDIACADALCEGSCSAQKYDCVGTKVVFAERNCDITRYTTCDETASNLCLETVTELCPYSFYEEVRRPCCNMTEVNPPEGCVSSGCSGSCDQPGVFHYSSLACGDSCPPWRDPETPRFGCAPCRLPTEIPAHVIAVADEFVSEITYTCEAGYWGQGFKSYCMSTDGSFYPLPSAIQCSLCSEPTVLEGDVFVANRTAGRIEYHCAEGFVGDPTYSVCDSQTGVWSDITAPYCDLVIESTPVVVVDATMDALVDSTPEVTPTETPTPSPSPTYSATRTPSASKSPRAPKVKGSRAPTQPPKLRVSAIPK